MPASPKPAAAAPAPKPAAAVNQRWHVLASRPEVNASKIQELREELKKESDLGLTYERWAWYLDDDAVLDRFLVARDDNVQKASRLIRDALAWRLKRRPHVLDYAELDRECATGKLRVAPSLDRFGRPVVIFDNSVQNTKDAGGQLRALAFVLEHALRRCDGSRVRKYVIFLHLNDFSLRNNPSWSVTKETMKMLICCFAECCGHIILHNAPSVFSVAYRLVKPLIDPKTATKILFVTDSDEDKMTELIGPDWRAITGAGQKRQDERSSPGYDHSVEWPITLENDRAWRERTGNEGPLSHEFTGFADEPSSPLAIEMARSVVTPSPIKREENPLEVEMLGGPSSPKSPDGPDSPLYDHARAFETPPRWRGSAAILGVACCVGGLTYHGAVGTPLDTPRRPA